MPGSLVQVATTTITSPTLDIDFGGYIDSSNVYKLYINNFRNASLQSVYIKFTESGTPTTALDYVFANQYMKAAGSWTDSFGTAAAIAATATIGSASGDNGNAIFTIFNAYDSLNHTVYTRLSSHTDTAQNTLGLQGSGAYQVNSQVDGVYIYGNNNHNFTSGTATLYKVI